MSNLYVLHGSLQEHHHQRSVQLPLTLQSLRNRTIKQHQATEKSVLKWLVVNFPEGVIPMGSIKFSLRLSLSLSRVSLPALAEAEKPPALHLVSVQSSELQPSEQLDQESWGKR